MSESKTEFERLLSAQSPSTPTGLRAGVESAVQKSLRRKTFIDDIKFLAVCFAVLGTVVGSQWAMLSSTNRQLQNISDTSIASTGDAKRVIVTLSKMKSPPGIVE